MSDPAYVTKGLPPPPAVSVVTRPIAGLLIDIYGLAEVSSPSVPLTCLWLLHPRTHSRAVMADFARRAVHAWNSSSGGQQHSDNRKDGSGHSSTGNTGSHSATRISWNPQTRGLVALVFDMPNHGSRGVGEEAVRAWGEGEGNAQHALDMAAMVRAGARDVGDVMDLVAGYLGRRVDGHVCLGWSLGAHAAWQVWMGEGRMDAAVAVVGCPDYMGLMGDRARENKLEFEGPFLGSKYFPQDLVDVCMTNDPKALLFGTGAVRVPTSPGRETEEREKEEEKEEEKEKERARLRGIMDARIRGKKLLLCFGARDRLVPYENSRPFVDFLKESCAKDGWYADGGVEVRDKVYEGVGHRFSGEMVQDAIAFLVERVREGPRGDLRARM